MNLDIMNTFPVIGLFLQNRLSNLPELQISKSTEHRLYHKTADENFFLSEFHPLNLLSGRDNNCNVRIGFVVHPRYVVSQHSAAPTESESFLIPHRFCGSKTHIHIEILRKV
jgi:hypothetical protein